MALKKYSTFSKAPGLAYNQIVFVSYLGNLLGRASHPFAGMKSVYSTAPADWDPSERMGVALDLPMKVDMS